MVISLAVLLVPVFVIIWMYRTLYGGDSVVTVDPTEAIASAERAGFTQLPPATAPEGWLIVTAQFRDDVLRIGYLDPERRGVQLIQSRSSAPGAAPDETVLTGSSGGMTMTLVTREADLTPLAGLLPIPVHEP